MRPILTPHSPGLALTYLATRAVECLALLIIGGYFLTTRTPWDGYVLPIYAASGAAGLALSVALLRSKLVPTNLSRLGIVGYAALVLGVLFDLAGVVTFDSAAGMVFLAPGGLFEIALPLYLIIRGFDLGSDVGADLDLGVGVDLDLDDVRSGPGGSLQLR